MEILLRILLLPPSVVSDPCYFSTASNRAAGDAKQTIIPRTFATTILCSLSAGQSSTGPIDWSTLLLIGLSDYFRAL